jgi:hypothetical protein
MFVWKKQSSQVTFRAGLPDRLLCCLLGTRSPSLRCAFLGRAG